MELSDLGQKIFLEKTPVTLTTSDGGAVVETTYTVYHKSWIDALPLLAELENAEKSDVPMVTRQLLILDAQVKEFTHEGKPVVMDADKWAIVGLPVQDALARELWRAKFGDFTDTNGAAEEKPQRKKKR